jgi:hypothetical protein
MGKNTTTTTNETRKKLTAKIMKCADLEVGQEVAGIYNGDSERPWLDTKTGEEKMIPQYHFEDPTTRERFVLFGDAGLKNAMSASGVQKGDKIAVQKLEMVELPGGRRVNQYDIFQLQ